MDNAQKKGRRDLMILIAVFMIPVVAAVIAFYQFGDSFTDGGKAKGNLTTPKTLLTTDDVPAVKLQDIYGKPVAPAAYHGRWTLMYISGQTCDEECKRNLYSMGQAYIFLASSGRSSQRARYVYIRQGSFDLAKVTGKKGKDDELFEPHHYMKAYSTDDLGPWLDAFKVDEKDPLTAKRTYLVDPYGRVMMWYPSLVQPLHIKDDWKHLIKKKR